MILYFKKMVQLYSCSFRVYLFTGLDHWTGLLDWTTGLTSDPKNYAYKLGSLLAPSLCQFVNYSADGLSGKLVPPILLVMI